MSDFGDRALLPALPAIGAGNIEDVLARVKEVLEVWQGVRGDGLDKVVTIRELLNAGVVDVPSAFTHLALPGTAPPDTAAPAQSAVPPTPTELKATGAMTSIVLEWVFPFEYTRLANFEVWRSATDALGSAVPIAEPLASIYTDQVGPNETFYYWVRAASDAALSPFNAVAGTAGSTAIDVGAALDALQGQISESELAIALGARINLIDAPSGTTGSVNARVLAETTARGAAIAAEASTRATAITSEATLRQTGDDALALQVSLITAGVAGGFDYGKVWYFDSGVEGWTSSGATQAHNTGWVEVDSSGADPAFLSPSGLAVSGSAYPVVKVRIRRLAGTEASWDGTCFYTTGGHGISSSFKKTISVPSPFAVGDTAIVEFAMDSLTAGGTDWITSTIDQIRLDFGADAADTIAVDWVAIGRNAPGASVAGLLTEQQARISGDTANASSITALTARVDDAEADILTEQTARANGDSANATSITALTARMTTAEGAITSEASTRATADTALSSTITSVSAVANAKNKTYRQAAAPGSGMTAGDVWFDSDDNNKAYRFDGAAWVATDDARIATNAAAITTEATARADGDTALASSISTVSAVANAKNKSYRQTAAPSSGMTAGDVWFDSDDNNKAYRYDGAAWVATDDARISANAAAIVTEQTTRANADTALSSQITTVSAVADSKNKTFRQSTAPASGMSTGDIWLDTANGNRAHRYESSSWVAVDDARIATNAAAIVTEQTARADGDTALASSISTVSAVANAKNKTYRQAAVPGSGMTTGDVWFDSDDDNKAYRYDGAAWVATDDVRIATNAAAISTEATARATETGYLGATYTLRLDVGGVVGGYGVSGTSIGGAGATIDFGIRANKFFIMPPSGVSNVGSAAFTYLATPTAVNGVTRPAGLYVSDAFIGNGVIDTARIGNLAVDTAKIADAAISSAKIGDAQITTAKIADATITRVKILDGEITASKIAAGTITTDKLFANAATSASASTGNGSNISLTSTATTATADTPSPALSLTTTGAPVKILATMEIDLFKGNIGAPHSGRFTAQLLIDGVLTGPLNEAYVSFSVNTGGGSSNAKATIPLLWRETLSAGTHTFQVRATIGGLKDSSGTTLQFGAASSWTPTVIMVVEENKV